VAATDEPSIRLLNLVTALQSTRLSLTLEEIRTRVPGYPKDEPRTSTEFEAFRRMFERDKDALRSLGIDVEVVDNLSTDPPTPGYRIRRERHELDDPGLTDQELAAVVAALQAVRLTGADLADPVGAMRKLGGVGAEAAPTPDEGLTVQIPEHLSTVLDAVLVRRVLELDYNGRIRRVEGDALRLQRGHWYLLGREQGVDGDRTYRVDRIDSIEAGEPDAYQRQEQDRRVLMRPWEYGGGTPVPVTLRVDDVAARTLLADDPELEVAGAGDHRTTVLEVVDEDRLFRFLASFLDRVEITEPAEVRTRYVAWLESIAVGDGAAGGAP